MTVRTPLRNMVPLLDLEAQYRPIRDEILAAVTRVCDSQRFIQGPEVEALERELADALGVAEAIGVSSGTDALLVALMALGIGAGDEVITSTYSFFATAGCIARLGATPAAGRHRRRRPTTCRRRLSAPRCRRARRPSFRSISTACAPTWIRSWPLPREAGVPVVEDACQAIGATYKGRQAGIDGDGRLLLVLSEQESRRVRRWRPGHDRGCGARARGPAAAESRRGDEVLPPADRRQLPPRRAAGGGPSREAAAPGVVDGHAPRQRRALSSAVRRPAARTRRSSCRSSPRGSFHIYNQFVVRVPRARPRARVPDRARHRHRGLLSRFRSTCRSASPRSDTAAAIFPPPKRPPSRRWRCPSTAS